MAYVHAHKIRHRPACPGDPIFWTWPAERMGRPHEARDDAHLSSRPLLLRRLVLFIVAAADGCRHFLAPLRGQTRARHGIAFEEEFGAEHAISAEAAKALAQFAPRHHDA